LVAAAQKKILDFDLQNIIQAAYIYSKPLRYSIRDE